MFNSTSIVATVVPYLVAIVGVFSVFSIHGTGVGNIAGNEMVGELKGFRSRWQGHSAQPSLHDFSDSFEPQSSSDFDHSWNHSKQDDTDEFFGPATETFNFDDDPVSQHESQDAVSDRLQFMQPKPKALSSKPRPQSSLSLAIKRTSDELASHHVHSTVLHMKQPWQRGPLSGIFTRQKPFWEHLQATDTVPIVGLLDHVAASQSSSQIPRPIQQTDLTLKRIRAARIVASDDNFRHVSLSRFKTMVLLGLDSTRLGQSLRSFAGTLCTDDELSQVFMDVFAPKATGTILKRCNALWRFSCWLQKWGTLSPFNQDEHVIYEYVYYLRNSGAGSTTPSQFVEALRFADTLLGFSSIALKDMLSARVTGAAHASFMTKRIRKPAEILRVDEIATLEQICINDPDVHRRIIAGHLLFSFAAAARWHDTMYVISLDLSTAGSLVLLEALTSKHKSSRGKEQQMELLPFTALGHVTCTESWGEEWVNTRILSGAAEWTQFLHSWSESAHSWVDAKMSTAEATGWLRELLEPAVGAERAATLTVHGLKATLLSWAAKSTAFTADEQLALGHHVSAQYRSAMIYSRDNQIGLCKKVHMMFSKIRDGTFDPDASRVSRLFQLAFDTVLEQQDDVSDGGSDSSSDASSVASSDGEHSSVVQRASYRRLEAANLDEELCLINNSSKVIHMMTGEDEKFFCGRTPSGFFRRVQREDLARAEAVICANCSHAYRASRRLGGHDG